MCSSVLADHRIRSSALFNGEVGVDYIVNLYTLLFGCISVPYPKAFCPEEQISNIKAIILAIEKCIGIELEHIAPQDVLNKESTSFADLREIMDAIYTIYTGNTAADKFSDETELSSANSSFSPELPRRRVEYFSPYLDSSLIVENSYGHPMFDRCGSASPIATPRDKAIIDIVENTSPKSNTDSGVITAIQKYPILENNKKKKVVREACESMSLLSERIREARTRARCLYDLSVKHQRNCAIPDLYDLRGCLLQLSDDIVATVGAIDRLSPNPLRLSDQDDTTEIRTPTEFDEDEEATKLEQLNNECERVLVEKKRLMQDCLMYCAQKFRSEIKVANSGRDGEITKS